MAEAPAAAWLPPEVDTTATAAPIGLDVQIAEVKRELALRENVYPSFVARSRLSAGEADQHYARLRAALHTLLWVQRNEADIRAALNARSDKRSKGG